MSVETRRQRMFAVRDELLAILREHEEEFHDGERCSDETVNALAFLCHSAGLHFNPRAGEEALEEFRALVTRTVDYQALHEEHHAH